jgi:hypothetical protein
MVVSAPPFPRFKPVGCGDLKVPLYLFPLNYFSLGIIIVSVFFHKNNQFRVSVSSFDFSFCRAKICKYSFFGLKLLPFTHHKVINKHNDITLRSGIFTI